VLFTFLAAVTNELEFVSGVMVLPQRQAVLVAKQAASLDVLSGGRFRLGIGTGWNVVEYEALGMDFGSRGARMEEQVAVMRALWSKDAVDFDGEFHTITDAGLNPLPARSIQIWFGGGGDRPHFGQTANLKALRRIARVGDGWIQPMMPYDRARELIEIFHGFCHEAGRDPASIGIEIRLDVHLATLDRWADEARAWRSSGASHLTVTTLGDGLYGVDAHLERLELARHVLEVSRATDGITRR